MNIHARIENNTVLVERQMPGGKWNKKKPLRTIKPVEGWQDRLRAWAKTQGHVVIVIHG